MKRSELIDIDHIDFQIADFFAGVFVVGKPEKLFESLARNPDLVRVGKAEKGAKQTAQERPVKSGIILVLSKSGFDRIQQVDLGVGCAVAKPRRPQRNADLDGVRLRFLRR
ncbi:MAG: hypothetical protein AAFX92_14380 [Pseudomonadota bacterium]